MLFEAGYKSDSREWHSNEMSRRFFRQSNESEKNFGCEVCKECNDRQVMRNQSQQEEVLQDVPKISQGLKKNDLAESELSVCMLTAQLIIFYQSYLEDVSSISKSLNWKTGNAQGKYSLPSAPKE